MRKTDPFTIDIILRHPTYSPERISKALSIKPHGAPAVGQKHGGPTTRSSFFCATLQRGETPSEYEGALTSVAQFIENHADFWSDFVAGSGEMELVLNHTIPQGAAPGDLCLRLRLEPRFLAELSNRGFGIRFQAWEGHL